MMDINEWNQSIKRLNEKRDENLRAMFTDSAAAQKETTVVQNQVKNPVLGDWVRIVKTSQTGSSYSDGKGWVLRWTPVMDPYCGLLGEVIYIQTAHGTTLFQIRFADEQVFLFIREWFQDPNKL